MEKDKIKDVVRNSYAEVAKASNEGYGCACGPGSVATAKSISLGVGYSQDETSSVPEGANLGLGCGNPTALASLKEGETVLDLGSGAGFDCLLAADKVGPTGKVVGLDMTHEMLHKSRENALKDGYQNV